ncbi:MAG: hypothetical protein M1837_002135 [Sclerophora amabilis]|nr:MAG: hypothetical protein M1837_002135 [Sclerophora amabilis]
MDAILQAQLLRVETALNTLIDSISSYTPSTQAAVALLEADDELSNQLEQLSIHQTNYARILHLQQTVDALSAQMTQSLTLLANTRAELLATPFTPFSKEGRDVPYTDLLAYAKRISKFTVPPTFRAPELPPEARAAEGGTPAAAATPKAEEGVQLNGTVNGDGGKKAGWAAGAGMGAGGEGVALASLTAEESQWFNTVRNLPFTPWPSDDTIRRGALARIQNMLEAGEDPTRIDAEEETKAESREEKEDETMLDADAERAAAEDVANAEDSGIPKTQPDESHRGGQTGSTTTADAAKVEKPAVFGGLDLYDPEDD